jgi:aspartate carbamoyltransferase
MTAKTSFLGRTVAVIADLSPDEQIHIYQKTQQLKEARRTRDNAIINLFRINNPDFGLYEVFLEASTRTRESFRNAAEFHRAKTSLFDTEHSSFGKGESYADTFDMLTGYDNGIFVIRSKLEGVCRWLEIAGKAYADRSDGEVTFAPAFINAGDGEHEHPTQELLDEFTFLEDNRWDRSNIHLALVGDLFHGRTTHSKVDGLTIFQDVKVDLVAPPDLEMPQHYIDRMKANGFEVRSFSSIAEYLAQGDVADKWYMTRLQLERMGEDVKRRERELKDPVVFRREYVNRLPDCTGFYHPLPRVKGDPILPTFLDNTKFNRYERQSRNGMLVRIVLTGAIAGVDFICSDFQGQQKQTREFIDDFVQEVQPHQTTKQYAEGVHPINDGIVIDHICRGEDPHSIRDHLTKVVRVLDLYGRGGEWVSESKETGEYKGIIFRPGHPNLNESLIKKLAAVAPGCTLNIVQSGKVVRKIRLKMPPRIYGLDEISCKNPACISYPEHLEGVPPEFYRSQNGSLTCKYCEHPHTFKQIWN